MMKIYLLLIAFVLVLTGCTGGTYDGYVHAECDPTVDTPAGKVTECRSTEKPIPTQTVPGPTETVTIPGPTVTETVTVSPTATATATPTPTPTPTPTAVVAVNVTECGANGADTVDDSNAIQECMDKAFNEKRDLFLPAGDYRTTTGIIHRDGVNAYGEGIDKTIIRNSGVASMDHAQAWLLGTYGPGNGGAATQHEKGYPIADTAAVGRTVTLENAADAAVFNVGDYVSWEGGTVGRGLTLAPNLPNGVAKVVEKAGNVLTLSTDVMVLTTVGVNPVVRKLNTGDIGALGPREAEGARLLVGGSLKQLTLITERSGYPAMNLSQFGFLVEDVKTRGWASIVGNPSAESTFRRITGEYHHMAVELAYNVHGIDIVDSTFTRYGTDPKPTATWDVWVNSSEGARDVDFTNVVLNGETTQALSGHKGVDLRQDSEWIGGSIRTDLANGGVLAYSGATMDGVTVFAESGTAIEVGGKSVVKNSDVKAAASGQKAIHVSVWADGATVTDNILRGPTAGCCTLSQLLVNHGKNTVSSGNTVG